MYEKMGLHVLRRVAGAVVFVLAVIALGCTSYFFLSSYETRTGVKRYESIATYAIDALSCGFDDKKSSVLTLAKAIQYGITNSSAWPNVYLPGFFDTGASLRDATGFDDMFFAPLVLPEQLPAYKDFLRAYFATEPAIPAGAGMPPYDVYGLNNHAEDRIYEETTGETKSYYSPNTFITPITQFLFDGTLNFNMHSMPQFGHSLDAIVECSKIHNYSEAIRVCTNISTILALPLGAPIPDIKLYHSRLLQPVYLNFNSSQLVGFVGGGFDWRAVLASPFETTHEDIDVVVRSGEIAVTYTTSAKRGLSIKGYGDLHEREYSHHRHDATLFASSDGSHNAATYRISIYPTKAYFRSYCTATPIVTATGGSFLLLLCAGAFLLYDRYMCKLAEASVMVLETKRRFVRFISHEIRTPLNAVHLGLEALTAEVGRATGHLLACLEDPSIDPPDILQILRGWKELSEEMMGNSESAVDVLNDLLNFDKIEMGTLRMEFSAVAIWDIVRNATIGFLTPAKYKNVRLTLDSNLDLDDGVDEHNGNQFVVIGDHARLSQVMRNFISNAIKFTPQTGLIKINVLRVADTFPHPTLLLPPESLHLLEQPRAGLGTGTTFTVELPLFLRIAKRAPRNVLQCHIAPALSTIPDHSWCGAPPTSHKYTLTLGAAAFEDNELRRRILVVDDAPSNRKMLIRILKANGYVCLQAEDGQQAIDRNVESVESHERFYAIIMDFEMPVMNGPTATGHLRAMGCTVPILGVTGNLLPDDVTFFKAQGANQVFGKPLDLTRFEDFMQEQEEERHHSVNCTPVPFYGSFMSDMV